MRRDIFSLLAAVTIAGTAAFAQNPASQTPSEQPRTTVTVQTPAATSAAPDATLTGCLIQGSGPNVYILENAKASAAVASDKGKSYVLTVAPSATVDFRSQLNHQVRIVGLSADGSKSAVVVSPGEPASPAASATVVKIEEKDMPRFSTRTITSIGDTCVAVG